MILTQQQKDLKALKHSELEAKLPQAKAQFTAAEKAFNANKNAKTAKALTTARILVSDIKFALLHTPEALAASNKQFIEGLKEILAL